MWAQTTCPQTDLYAKGLDAYTIVIAEKAVSLNFQIDFSSEEEPYQIWRELLKDCGRSKASNPFESFVASVEQLSQLGADWQQLEWWRRREHWKLRKRISSQENGSS